MRLPALLLAPAAALALSASAGGQSLGGDQDPAYTGGDSGPAQLSVKVLDRRPGALASDGRVRVRVQVDRVAIVELRGTVRPGGTLGAKRLVFRDAGTRTVDLPLARSARHGLRGHRSARVSVSATTPDGAGGHLRRSARRTLRR